MSTPARISLTLLLMNLPGVAYADDTEKALHDLHELNQVVIKAASLAQRRAARDDIEAYARRLVMDHRFADYQVLDLASDLGLDISKPAAPRPDEAKGQDQLLQRSAELESLTGPEFELAFIRTMRAVHTHAIDVLSRAQRRSAPSLVRMLDRLIPIFEQHVELAIHLSGSSEARAEK